MIWLILFYRLFSGHRSRFADSGFPKSNVLLILDWQTSRACPSGFMCSELFHIDILICPTHASQSTPRFHMEIAAWLKTVMKRHMMRHKTAPRDSLSKPAVIRWILVNVLFYSWHKVATRHLWLGLVFFPVSIDCVAANEAIWRYQLPIAAKEKLKRSSIRSRTKPASKYLHQLVRTAIASRKAANSSS